MFALDTRDLLLAVAVIVLGATGTFLLLPHRLGAVRTRPAHLVGIALSALSAILFALFWEPPGPLLTSLFFYAFALSAIIGGILMITSRDPVHSALWFASVVLSTSGLFLLAGAQFLAAGTVIVYAGAIIVTFLFVIMLAQQEGRAVYDRAARAPMRSTLTCFLLLWGLLYALLSVKASHTSDQAAIVRPAAILGVDPEGSGQVQVLRRSLTSTALLPPEVETRPSPTDVPPHVAGLGATLFTDHLIAVEVAGVLLFIALVGAVVIASPKPPIRPGQSRAASGAEAESTRT